MNSAFTYILPFLLAAIFAFVAWLIFAIVSYFLRPGAAKELIFPGAPDEMVTRRKRLLSLYEIYTPTLSKEEKNDSRRYSASRVISVLPKVATIDEKCEDLPPSYAQIVLAVDKLPSQPPPFDSVRKDVEA